ncbi:MAG: SDR family oxidoreductase [Terracidiphilus sp.]|jgi:NAD(P)-dependent dehydrogenase (short-subunit alcohol dehydrogenase family)
MEKTAAVANGQKPESAPPVSFDLAELTKMYDFTGKTVAITGGAGILGSEIACALVGCGAKVAILDVNVDAGKALVESMGARGKQMSVFKCDVLNRESIGQTAQEVVSHLGKLDCLINGAGGNKPQATTSAELKFFDLSADAVRWVFELNVMGTILPSQAFGKVMAEQGYGTILNISSMNSFRPLTRIPAYSAAKAAVSNFTQWLAVHMAQEYTPKIRVNAIAPGFFLTNQNRFLMTDRETGDWTPRGKTIIGHTPMGRLGESKDLFGCVLWLLSPASEFVTGVVIPVDGGFSAFSGV